MFAITEQHVDLITRDMLKTLVSHDEGPCVSLYMPTHEVGQDIEQDPIRLKNLLNKAEAMLLEWGMRKPEVDPFLKPARRLLYEEERDFWQRQNKGLAVFLAPEDSHVFRLPVAFKELVSVNMRFHIKPMLPTLSGDGQFYILALSQGSVRLLQGTRYDVSEVELTDVPLSLEDTLQYDVFEDQVQFHTSTDSGMGGQGARQAIFHSHGESDDSKVKERQRRFLRALENGITNILDDTQAPLILAGVDYIRSMYREVSKYKYLVADGIDGNPETMLNQDLHKQGWEIVAPIFAQARAEAEDRYRQLAGQGDERATSDLKAVLNAALYERVDTLFVPLYKQHWGIFDPRNNQIEFRETPQPGDDDLLDFAAAHTLKNGGTVYTVEDDNMPADEAEIAAILRY